MSNEFLRSHLIPVKFWGALACFTNQNAHPERYSYPVPTPSAIKGMLEAIFWKPEFKYLPIRVRVLNPLKQILICRNELKFDGKKPPISIQNERTQIYTKALKDVCYIIETDIVPNDGSYDSKMKYRAQLMKRIDRGRRYHQPCFGCREFIAHFSAPDGTEEPISWNTDLGAMFYGINHKTGSKCFFHAKVSDGVMEIPNLSW